MITNVRPVEARDHDAWKTLWDAYCDFYEVTIPASVTESSWRRLLADVEPNVFGLVAEQDGRVVGIANCVLHLSTWNIEPRCYLNDLYVAEDARGTGVGKALIQHLQDMAATQKWAKVYWLTHESNAAARKLYDSLTPPSGFIQYSVEPQLKP